jgi:hypothetical protein
MSYTAAYFLRSGFHSSALGRPDNFHWRVVAIKDGAINLLVFQWIRPRDGGNQEYPATVVSAFVPDAVIYVTTAPQK